MRAACRVLVVLGSVALLCGCGSPKSSFGKLRKAALNRDPAVIWANITPETQADLEALGRSAGLAGSGSEGASPGFAYLKSLAVGLDDMAVEYIRTLRPGTVSTTGDTALMSIGSYRFGPSDKTLVFRKVDGRWKWDARDILKWYLRTTRGDYHQDMLTGGF